MSWFVSATIELRLLGGADVEGSTGSGAIMGISAVLNALA